jgi:hypothetical protein
MFSKKSQPTYTGESQYSMLTRSKTPKIIKKSWSQQILQEDSMAVRGNRIEGNTNRALEAVQRRLDLQALVKDFDTLMPRAYSDSIVNFFVNE